MGEDRMSLGRRRGQKIQRPGFILALHLLAVASTYGQGKPLTEKKAAAEARPKLVVMIVVDQMRADYVDKFAGQWSAGLKRLVEEGAWFRTAAYPYAATETCVGHATVSTGALPTSHGMVANAWFDRQTQKMVTCTSDPTVKNSAYAGGTTSGGDSAWRMLIPAFAEELKFQSGGGTRVVTFSLKARAAITMAGHKADAATWFDSATGAWLTSSAYGTMPFVDEFATKHPAAEDYGKTWSLALPASAYVYDEKTVGATALEGWTTSFPHALHGREGSSAADQAFFEQWVTSPYADSSLTKLAEAAVDSLGLGQGGVTDFLGVSYSSVDYVGHTFGPRSWEIQDILVRLDQDLGELFTLLDHKVGKGNYVVAFTADHGVAPIPVDMQMTGVDAGVLRLPDLKNKIENALQPFHLGKPAVARIAGNEVYFSPGVYNQLRQDPAAMKAVIDEALTVPGVAAVFRSEDLSGPSKTLSGLRTAAELSYFAGRSGDLYVLQQPYWLTDSSAEGTKRYTGTGHGTPYYYDQRVPILIMGYGIKPGEYFESVTPADIAPTFAALTGVTLSTHDGRALSEAFSAAAAK
jgi:predicted AlkP superfamily pyrophosphatase or phosphodiesterase